MYRKDMVMLFRTIVIRAIVIVAVTISLNSPGEARVTGEKISLQEPVSKALNEVLEQASQLHDAFFNQSDQEIETYLRELVTSIEGARRVAMIEKINGFHLNRVLETAYNHFKSLMKSVGEERTKGLRLGYEQIVLIAQTYRLNSYKIFYCGKNDTIWLQKNYKPQNPINPNTFGDCGTPIR